jgi:TPR repeat protein
MSPARAGRILVMATGLAALAACSRRAPPTEEAPAPSASVIQIGVGVGACSDVDACERECDAGSADRCRRLAASHEQGQGTPKDEALATALYERACDLGDAAGCVFAGRMHEYAHGVPEDVPAAARLYERACTMQTVPSAAGCYNLAIVLERGRGVPRDPSRAADLYQRACNAGAKAACAQAAALRDAGATGVPDAGRGAGEPRGDR